MKSTKIFISGTVQGVFFRNFIKDKANELGLKGFARNLEMVKICRKGPAHSDVKNVETQEIKHQGLSGFKVLKGF